MRRAHIGIADETGTIEPGKSADLAIWNCATPAELAYRIGFNPLHRRIFKGQSTMTITLTPGSVSLQTLADIYWNGTPVVIEPSFDAGINRAAARIAEIAAGNAPVYGVNTGFGKLASIKIDAADVATLQRNLILSHCCGVGAPLPDAIVRLIMSLKLVSLGRGASGVRSS